MLRLSGAQKPAHTSTALAGVAVYHACMAKTSQPSSEMPQVVISPRGAARLKSGHVWVYRSDVISDGQAAPGSLVTVTDQRRRTLGSALYSTASQIAIRMLSPQPVTGLTGLIQQRIHEAVAYRESLVRDSDAYRVVFSEADRLPGLIVDRYNDVLSLQVLTQAMDRNTVRQTVVSALSDALHPSGVVERVEARVRQLEALPPRESGLVAGTKSSTLFTMNGVCFHFDALQGQKTGAFLDQRENYAAAARHAHGEALDVFCYQGGFALHLAPHCSQVTAVDSSRSALETADQNATLNRREIEWIEGNAFDLLRDYSTAGRQYDTIVLDPPAFAKTKASAETALRGYKELNLRAFKMLRPGGLLVSCSCSHHVSPTDFLAVVAAAAADARRSTRVLEQRGAASDHPISLGIPETAYLKCLIVNVTLTKQRQYFY
jgi:23S rRNA (cytosine1962-C5)-methyltransferase